MKVEGGSGWGLKKLRRGGMMGRGEIYLFVVVLFLILILVLKSFCLVSWITYTRLVLSYVNVYA